MEFDEILARSAARHIGQKRWGRALLSTAVALAVGLSGAAVKIGSDVYIAHENRIVATAQASASAQLGRDQRASLERQATCHELFVYVTDDTPNKQIEKQAQARIDSVIEQGLRNCALLPDASGSRVPLALPAPTGSKK